MRFRTQLRQVRLLVQALTAVNRVSKGDVVWKLSERRLLLISGGGGSGSVEVVCSITTSQVMEAMRIESQQDNQIYLRIEAASLLRVLKPAERARNVTMKLSVCHETRKPLLQFCMAVKGIASAQQDVTHDIPVSVMTDEEVGDMLVPDVANLGADAVSIYLPTLSELRPFVERMSKITDRLDATATVFGGGEHGDPGSGTLELRVRTPLFSSAMQFRNLGTSKVETDGAPPAATAAPDDGMGGRRTEVCTLDSRKLLSVLEVDKIAPSQVLAHFSGSKQMVVQATANGVDLTIMFLLPCLPTQT